MPVLGGIVQVKEYRFRVPDVCVIFAEAPKESILTHPPLLCIEILSPEDRMSEILERVKDYLAFGVRYVWVLDPRTGVLTSIAATACTK
jgi:Uma2 family endonuclease